MRILVTGANGFVGHHLCRRLCADSHTVFGLVHRRRHRLPAETTAVVGDVLDSDSLHAILRDAGPIDVIAHLATEPPGPAPRTGVNVAGTRKLLAAAQACGVSRLVHASSMSVFDFLAADLPLPLSEGAPTAPLDDYGHEKLAAEQLLVSAAGETSIAILRLAGVYGPGKEAGAAYNFLRAARQESPIDIEQDRAVDLLWVIDAVDALAAALVRTDAEGTLHVGSGEAVRLSEVATRAYLAAGHEKETARRCITVGRPGNAFCLDIESARQRLAFTPTPMSQAFGDWLRYLEGRQEEA